MKPNYDAEKGGLYGLGYIPNITAALTALSNRIGFYVSKEDLETNLISAYNAGNLFYYEYDGSGAPACVQDFTGRCAAFAIDTGYTDAYDGTPILAQYSKTNRGWIGVYFCTNAQILANMQAYKIGALSFRDYAGANAFIKDLESILLPGETWAYTKTSDNLPRPKTAFQILESYLTVISTVLVQECQKENSINKGKIKFSANNAYAAFNTGLLSNKVTDVFVIGEVFPKNWNGVGTFQISNPWILKGGRTELNTYSFTGDVLSTDMVSFFENLSHIVYDATIPIDVDDLDKLEHCIDDGIARNRFPAYYKEQWENGYKDDVIDKFKQAISRAQKIARRNYKYVVPQYRSPKDKEGSIQFLMPIYFSSNYAATPDFALVLSKNEIGGDAFYRPETILELSWAYNNARVLCKPDNTWLRPEDIEEAGADDFEG